MLISIKPKSAHGLHSTLRGGSIIPSSSLTHTVIGGGGPEIEPLFYDNFDNGTKAGSQNGCAWAGINLGSEAQGDSIYVEADPDAPSGHALIFQYGGDVSFQADAHTEHRLTLPYLSEVHYRMRIYPDLNYVHRNDPIGPDNNKLIRIWDINYNDVIVKVGCSTIPGGSGNVGPHSVVQTEYVKGAGETGSEVIGPFTRIFDAGVEVLFEFYSHVASGPGVFDGVIKMWKNGVQIANYTGLNLCDDASVTSTAGNFFRNSYIFGWANSGFTATTKMKLREFTIFPTSPY